MTFITLENGQDYYLVAKTSIDNRIYYMLVNEKSYKDVVIRKEVDDELVGLDDMNEFKSVIVSFYKDNENNPEIMKYLIDFNKK